MQKIPTAAGLSFPDFSVRVFPQCELPICCPCCGRIFYGTINSTCPHCGLQ